MFGTVKYNTYNFPSCALTDVCDFQGGSQPPKSEWVQESRDGYIRMLQIRDFTQSRNVNKEYVKISDSIKICDEQDILIGRYGASVGKILTGMAGAYNVAIMKSIPDKTKLNNAYLYRFFVSDEFQTLIINASSGRAAQQGFNKDDLSKIKILLPPLNLQNKFGEFVKHLDKSKFAIKETFKKILKFKKNI